MAAVARVVAAVDPGTLSGEAAVALLELAGEIERLGAGLRLLVAARAAESAAWRDEGHRSSAAWLASMARTPVGDARSSLETSERLASMPVTCDALRAGELSAAQAGAITAAAAADPTVERDLLEAAGELSVGGLRQLCRHVRAEAPAPHGDAAARRRSLRFWTDPEGMLRLTGAFTADAGAQLVAAVRSRAAFVADESAAAGVEPEPQDAYDADALVALACGDRRTATFGGNVGGCTRQLGVVLHVRLDALRRGSEDSQSPCEIPAIGRVPAEIAESLVGDADLVLEVRHGGDVLATASPWPAVPAEVAAALAARDRVCVVPGCPVSLSLHTVFWQVPWASGGPPELWNLAKLCAAHHRLKVHRGFELAGGPGDWEWRAPP